MLNHAQFIWSAADLLSSKNVSRSRFAAGLRSELAPAEERYRRAWQRALTSTGEPNGAEGKAEIERLRDFRSTALQYINAYEFFSQVINYADPYMEKLAAYLAMLVRLIREQTVLSDVVDLTDVVMSHFRFEEQAEQNIDLEPGAAMGLDGMTEAGMTQQREKALVARRTVVEMMNDLFGGSDLTDADRGATTQVLMTSLVKNKQLQAQAVNYPPDVFSRSTLLQAAAEESIWTGEAQVKLGFDALRLQETGRVIRLPLNAGLQQSLIDEAHFGDTRGHDDPGEGGATTEKDCQREHEGQAGSAVPR